MKNNSPKRIALKTLTKYKCYTLNHYTDLQRIIELNQFTIIEYKKHTNSKPVSELIKRLRIESEIEKNNSFLYINNNLKFVFLNAGLSVEEKCALLRHELGHICDPGLKNSDVHDSKIRQEEFANAFSCYTKSPGFRFMISVFLAKRWKLFVVTTVLISCVLGYSFITRPRTSAPVNPVNGVGTTRAISDRLYYVSSAGKKFHRKHCIIIKYKNNLTQIQPDDAINAGYEPCLICNPGEE